MKVCPIQKYGMKPVMEYYIESGGEILGKGTDNLEGFTFPDKGYFGPGQLPTFDRNFFDMPKGRAEDWLLLEFRDKLFENAAADGKEKEDMWTEFREKVEDSLSRRGESVDMGMDLGV
jgi:hypothetical protein